MKHLMQPYVVGDDIGLFLVNFERVCEGKDFTRTGGLGHDTLNGPEMPPKGFFFMFSLTFHLDSPVTLNRLSHATLISLSTMGLINYRLFASLSQLRGAYKGANWWLEKNVT